MSSRKDTGSPPDERDEGQKTDVTLKLIPKKDKHGNTYHIARTDAPILLDLRECTIFVFTRDQPELSIRRTKLSPGQKRKDS
jgi:hypothetical protein